MISEFFLFISWNIDPALYDGVITLRYYSLLFAISFLVVFNIVKKLFINENAPVEWMDKLLMYYLNRNKILMFSFFFLNYYMKN